MKYTPTKCCCDVVLVLLKVEQIHVLWFGGGLVLEGDRCYAIHE